MCMSIVKGLRSQAVQYEIEKYGKKRKLKGFRTKALSSTGDSDASSWAWCSTRQFNEIVIEELLSLFAVAIRDHNQKRAHDESQRKINSCDTSSTSSTGGNISTTTAGERKKLHFFLNAVDEKVY